MTIKRLLFFSHIRLFLVTILGLGLISTFRTNIVAAYILAGTQGYVDVETFRNMRWPLAPVFFVVLVVLFLVISSMLSHGMIKRITKSLDILGDGVKQIQNNNFSYRVVHNTNDEFRSVCNAFNHMAEQLEASTNRRLKDEANRRELLAGISHDLRTPITTINGYLDGLESGVASTPEMREKYFATIKNNALNMKHIIEQLFLFSKLDMDEFPFSPHRVSVKHALSDMIEELADEYAMKGLVIEIDDSFGNAFVNTDVLQLRRVLINILENSAKYRKEEIGRLKISASVDSDFIRLTFADDGPGVLPELLPNLFNAFFRSDPSRDTKGSGLGLAISAKIIERSGGTIHAENADAGGLVIVIRLPIIKEEEGRRT